MPPIAERLGSALEDRPLSVFTAWPFKNILPRKEAWGFVSVFLVPDEKLIYPVSFYITKAKHLKTISNTITKVPKTRKELIELPGVGIKTANLFH